jgi:hypothetical protein
MVRLVNTLYSVLSLHAVAGIFHDEAKTRLGESWDYGAYDVLH